MATDTTTQPERATYTATEVARLLGISRASVYAAAHRGDLPGAITIGGRIVVARTALDRVLGVEQSSR